MKKACLLLLLLALLGFTSCRKSEKVYGITSTYLFCNGTNDTLTINNDMLGHYIPLSPGEQTIMYFKVRKGNEIIYYSEDPMFKWKIFHDILNVQKTKTMISWPYDYDYNTHTPYNPNAWTMSVESGDYQHVSYRFVFTILPSDISEQNINPLQTDLL